MDKGLIFCTILIYGDRYVKGHTGIFLIIKKPNSIIKKEYPKVEEKTKLFKYFESLNIYTLIQTKYRYIRKGKPNIKIILSLIAETN